jgi:hypothetical protein
MATPLGAHFVRQCLEPERVAATKLGQGRLPEAFAALEADKLRNALQTGIDAVAKHAGVRAETVRQGLPHVELSSTIEAIGGAREHARASLGQFVGSVGSLLPGVQPDAKRASEELAALASKYALDAHIHDPLQGLADHVARWEQLVAAAGDGLSRSPTLRAAVLRRMLVRVAVVAIIALLLCAAVMFLAWQRIVVTGARNRVDLLIAHNDPCAGASVSPNDVSHATTEQLARLADKAKACESVREREAHVDGCRVLAEHVDAGELGPADVALARESAALLRRVAARKLTKDDLQVGSAGMPCQDTPSAKRLWDAYTESAATTTSFWGDPERVSDHVLSLLRERKGGALDDASREALVARTEVVTKRAITSGLPTELEHARKLCGLVAALGYPAEPWCKALARIDKREESATP